MKGVMFFFVLFFVSILHLDAFLPPQQRIRASNRQRMPSLSENLTHGDLIWKVRPPSEVSRLQKLWLKIAANVIRLDSMIKREDPPLVLCPKGGRAVLEAHYRPVSSKRYQKIGRFGFTTERGPSIPPISETVDDLYGIKQGLIVGTGAIIYMYVEEPHRKKNVGALALEVISLIQAIQGCDFTVIVADDDGSGKLISWYEDHGYKKAPKLQTVFGSPDAKYGLTMISPTRQVLPEDCSIQWW